MAIISDYLATLEPEARRTLQHMYDIARTEVPEATEAIYYGMVALKYNGKGLFSAQATKQFLSLYPFCAIERLGLDVSAYEGTKGSIHFSAARPIPDDLLRRIIAARKRLIDAGER